MRPGQLGVLFLPSFLIAREGESERERQERGREREKKRDRGEWRKHSGFWDHRI